MTYTNQVVRATSSDFDTGYISYFYNAFAGDGFTTDAQIRAGNGQEYATSYDQRHTIGVDVTKRFNKLFETSVILDAGSGFPFSGGLAGLPGGEGADAQHTIQGNFNEVPVTLFDKSTLQPLNPVPGRSGWHYKISLNSNFYLTPTTNLFFDVDNVFDKQTVLNYATTTQAGAPYYAGPTAEYPAGTHLLRAVHDHHTDLRDIRLPHQILSLARRERGAEPAPPSPCRLLTKGIKLFPMIQTKHINRAALLAAFGTSAAILLSGCGGTTTNSTQTPATQADPQVYGQNFATGLTGSNFSFPIGANTVGAITGAISSTAAGFALEGGVAPGFVAGGQNPIAVPTATDAKQTGTPPFLSFGFAMATSQPSVTFRALVANGNNGETVDPINPSSVVLTTPEVPAFSAPLTFDNAGIGTGPNGDGQYTTAAFTLPFTTTGLHTFKVAVAAASGKSSSTTFQTVVLAPTASAVVVQILDATGAAVAGALVTVTNPLPGVAAYKSTAAAPQTSVSDGNGVAIVFAAPGAQTISATATDAKGNPLSGSDTETLVAGQALTAVANTSGAAGDALESAYAIEVVAPAAAAVRQGHSRVQGHLVKRH